MKLAVCETPAELVYGDIGWRRLVDCAKPMRSDILLLSEMPFGRWVAADPKPDARVLASSHELHDEGLKHLSELGAEVLLGTRPTFERQRSVNLAFVWTVSGFRAVHTKQFFPDEQGYFEARWFERGELRFELAEALGIKLGFLTCTDVMFLEWARYYGRRGAHVIAVPRATPEPSLGRWKTVMSAAAITSGCYVASSNRAGTDAAGQEFGGRGWVFAPSGNLVAETSPHEPVVAADLDLDLVHQAKTGYPSYVEDLHGDDITRLLTT